MAHFELGTDKPTYLESEKAMRNKSSQKIISKFVQFREPLRESTTVGSNNNNQAVNFSTKQMPDDPNQYISMNKRAADQIHSGESALKINNNEKKALDDLKKETRKAHFQFGTDSINYVSHASSMMVAHEMPKQSNLGEE